MENETKKTGKTPCKKIIPIVFLLVGVALFLYGLVQILAGTGNMTQTLAIVKSIYACGFTCCGLLITCICALKLN